MIPEYDYQFLADRVKQLETGRRGLQDIVSKKIESLTQEGLSDIERKIKEKEIERLIAEIESIRAEIDDKNSVINEGKGKNSRGRSSCINLI